MATDKVNGININCKVEGHGEPLAMIMGFTASRSDRVAQVPYFRE